MEAFELSYQGWSGCVVRTPALSFATPLVFDPAPDLEIEPIETMLLVTHGHFEHVQGALAHLRRAPRAPVTVIASTTLCRWLERRSKHPGDRFVAVSAGSRLEAGGWNVRVFEWEHMPLLPPGAGPAARYLFKLMKHPRGLAKMALGGATGPRFKPMLGYCVQAKGSKEWLVYYGEGVHRCTSREQLRAVLDNDPVDTLVFGAEPEDAAALPELLAGHRVAKMFAFEPHRPWRAEFHLPQLDVAGLAARLRAKGIDARLLAAGDSVPLRTWPVIGP